MAELTSGYASLEALMVEELESLLDAEKQQIKILPQLVRGVETEELKEAFKEHLEETKKNVDKFEEIFKFIKVEAKKVICKPMRALIREEKVILKNRENSLLKDAALIGAVLKAANYEIVCYQTVMSQTKQLRQSKVIELLGESLSEKNKICKTLIKILDGSFFKMGITSQIATMPEPIKS